MILDKTASLFRLTTNPNDSDVQDYTKVLPSFAINIQPISDETQSLVGGAYGHTYLGFTSVSGIRENDIITVSGTTTVSGYRYVVRGVKDWFHGPLPHLELLLEEGGL